MGQRAKASLMVILCVHVCFEYDNNALVSGVGQSQGRTRQSSSRSTQQSRSFSRFFKLGQIRLCGATLL